MTKFFLIVVCWLYLTSFSHSVPITDKPQTSDPMFENCPTTKESIIQMKNTGFTPVMSVYEPSLNKTTTVWFNHNHTKSIFIVSDGTKSCIIFYGSEITIKYNSSVYSL